MTKKCLKIGCENQIEVLPGHRPKAFCSDKCRQAYKRAKSETLYRDLPNTTNTPIKEPVAAPVLPIPEEPADPKDLPLPPIPLTAAQNIAQFLQKNRNRTRPEIKFKHPEWPSVDCSVYMPTQRDANINALIHGLPLPFPNQSDGPLPAGFKA